MVNITRAAECLENLVGFRSSQNNCVTGLDAALTGSESSLNVMDEPGLTQSVIEDAMSDDYSDVSEYLNFLRTSEIKTTLQSFINQHKALTSAREYQNNVAIVKKMAYFPEIVTKAGRFVGIEIHPQQSNNIAAIIRQLGVQFNTVNATLKIYLFESSQNEAIATFDLTAHTKVNSLQWFEVSDFIANYKWEEGATNARYYLGYFEADLVGNAVQTLLALNCCGNEEWVGAYQEYVMIRGVQFPATALNGTDLPDTRAVQYSEETFGLHFKIDVKCDITDTICDNRLMFAHLLVKKIARRIWWDFYNTTRINRKADMARDRALPNITRLDEEIKTELKGIKLDFTDIDELCMPCNDKFLRSGQLR